MVLKIRIGRITDTPERIFLFRSDNPILPSLGVRCPSLTFHILIFFSDTTRPIGTKLSWNNVRKFLYKNASFCSDRYNNMAVRQRQLKFLIDRIQKSFRLIEWCLTPTFAVFQLYCGVLFNCSYKSKWFVTIDVCYIP